MYIYTNLFNVKTKRWLNMVKQINGVQSDIHVHFNIKSWCCKNYFSYSYSYTIKTFVCIMSVPGSEESGFIARHILLSNTVIMQMWTVVVAKKAREQTRQWCEIVR